MTVLSRFGLSVKELRAKPRAKAQKKLLPILKIEK